MSRRAVDFGSAGAMGRAGRWLVASVMLVHFGPAQSGSTPDLPLVQMSHKSWTARDGAPQNIRSLAQAPDGTLWIGSEGGLYNFDGRAFKAFSPPPGETDLPAGPVISLCVARDGTLWLGTYQGVARVAQGHVTRYPSADAVPLASVGNLHEASDGTIWGASRKALVRIGADATAHLEPTPLPLSTNRINGFFIDSSNTQWLGQGGRLYRRALGQQSYEPTDVQVDFVFGWAETLDGSLWIADFTRGRGGIGRKQRVDRDGKLAASLKDDSTPSDVLFIPDGSLVVGTQSFGVRKFRVDGTANPAMPDVGQAPDVFTHAEGLSSDATGALLRDADGNIWVGGRRGLDRFRTARLIPFRATDTSSRWSVCANPQGEVWVASLDNLYKVAGGTVKSFSRGDVYQLLCGSDGDTWLVSGLGIWKVHADQITQVAAVPGAGTYGYSHLVSTSGDSLIASVGEPASATGIWQHKEGQWTRLAGAGLPDRNARALYIDPQRRLWAGYADGQITLSVDGVGQVFEPVNPGVENIWAFLQTSLGMFAAGGNGLAVRRGPGFQLLKFADPTSVRGIGSLVESRNGDLWLNASRGVVHLRASELRAALANPEYRMKSELVTEGEFTGPAEVLKRATAARDAEGNLWFATSSGVFHLNPEIVQPESRAPIVSLRSLLVDGHPLDTRKTVGPHSQSLEVQYLGVSLKAPERVTYRYRLEGFENNWQEAGHRTEAIYTQLRPGTYIFHVIASNDDGVWTAPVSSPPITVLPSFYQTTWFAVLCAIAGLLLLIGMISLRLRAITRAVRARAEERADERIRIARDLHDTLLQGIQGLLLNFHVAAQKIAPDEESKLMLDRALSTADRVIIEGRNRVSSLRSDHLTDPELVGAIESVGRDLALGDTVQFRVKRSGAAAELHPHVADEIFNIAREAITNAFRHSEATRIEVELRYGLRFFSLSCEDNGSGFEQRDQGKAGHWGLKGMIERAAKLGGKFRCRSEPTQGTQISVSIPSYRAYRKHSRALFYLRAMRWSKGGFEAS